MKLLLDQGLPRSSVGMLHELGIDALHTGECGLARAPDSDIIDFARREGRIIITLDADFHALMALGGATAPSVVRFRVEGLQAKGLVELLTRVLERCQDDLGKGALVSVMPGQIRLRRLPIISSDRSEAPRGS